MNQENPGEEASDEDEKYRKSCGEPLEESGVCPGCEEENRSEEDATFPDSDSTGLAALTHVIAYFTWIVGPAVVYIVTEEEYVKENAANAFNWQLSFFIYMLISMVLTVILIGFLFALVLALLDIVFCVIAAIKAADGETWEYPITIDIL